MGYGALTAFMEADRIPPSGILVTAVLPGGCPLACPPCIVHQRDERRETSYVTAEHLTGLLDGVARRGLLGGAAIVGDEPLQPHCWPDARRFLDRARALGAPTALITSGYHLIDYVEELRRLEGAKIVVSLDAADERHDAIRRKPGAFARIAEGVRRAAEDDALRGRMSIASILMPGNLDAMSGLIAFTAANRIPQLLLSPLLTSSRTAPLAVHPKIMRDAWRAIPALLGEAEAAGVKLRLSDEFAMLGPWEEKLAETGIEVLAPRQPAKLIRVDAAGRIETLASMQEGRTTGLQLPADPAAIDSFAAQLAESCFPASQLAA